MVDEGKTGRAESGIEFGRLGKVEYTSTRRGMPAGSPNPSYPPCSVRFSVFVFDRVHIYIKVDFQDSMSFVTRALERSFHEN